MSVDIPISANAGTVVGALNQIRTAIAQASGEAKNFAQIDLSHSEVGKLSAEIKTVLKNFEDLVRLGRGGTAAGVRSALSAGGINPASLAAGGDTERLRALTVWADNVGRQYPDAAERRRNINNVVGHVTGGTSLGADPDEPAPSPGQPPKPPREDARPPRRSEGFFARHGRAAGGGLGSLFGGEGGASLGGSLGAGVGALIPELALPLLGFAGVKGVGKLVGQAYTQAQGEDKADDQLLRIIQGSGDDFGKLRDAAREASKGLMLTYEQSARLGATFAQIANISDPAAAFKGMQQAVGFGNAYGIDAQTATTSFAQASLLGMDPERFATLIAAATAAGNDKSQTPQVMQAILSFAQTASRYLVTSGAVNGATGNFASMYAAMQATDQPGLMGANGSALLGQINAATMSGGAAGLPGQVATYQAFARAGITDPYAVQYDLSGGAFAKIGLANGKDTNAYSLMQGYFDQYGPRGKNNYRREFAEAQYYGINMRQAGAMESITPANLDALPGQLDTYGINADQLNMAALPGIVCLLNNPGSAASVKKSLLANGALSKTDAAAINAAGDDPKALMKALVQGLNDTGLQQTDSTKNTQAITDLNNAITAAGSGLVPAVSKLTDGMAALLGPVGSISKDLDFLLGTSQKSADSKANAKLAAMGVTSNPGRGGLHAYGPVPNPGAATRGMRNNNPLDLGYVAGDFGLQGSDGRFGMYDTEADGIAAAVRQVRRYETGQTTGRKLMTLKDIDSTWTPRNAENPHADYDLSQIELLTGLKDNSDLTNPSNLARYIQMKAAYESNTGVSTAQADAAVRAGYNLDTTHTVVLKMQHPNGQTTTHPVPKTGAPVIVPYNLPGHA